MPKTKHKSAGIVIKQGDKYLICRSTKCYDKSGHEVWGIPKGKIDKGETPVQAAVRETWEETNLKFKEDDLTFLCEYRANKKKYMYVYFIEVPENYDVILFCCCNTKVDNRNYPEIDSYKLITLDEWDDYIHNHMRKIKEYL